MPVAAPGTTPLGRRSSAQNPALPGRPRPIIPGPRPLAIPRHAHEALPVRARPPSPAAGQPHPAPTRMGQPAPGPPSLGAAPHLRVQRVGGTGTGSLSPTPRRRGSPIPFKLGSASTATSTVPPKRASSDAQRISPSETLNHELKCTLLRGLTCALGLYMGFFETSGRRLPTARCPSKYSLPACASRSGKPIVLLRATGDLSLRTGPFTSGSRLGDPSARVLLIGSVQPAAAAAAAASVGADASRAARASRAAACERHIAAWLPSYQCTRWQSREQ